MMDNETEAIYLQKLEEFIADEDKIVTVTWLSHKLNISASEARRLLNKYVKDHRVSKPDELAVLYLLSVILEDDTLSVSLIKENEVEEKTKKFKKVLEQQIYSVQKCKQVDFVPTSLIDPFDAGETNDVPIKDTIVSKLCIPRTFKVRKALPPPPAPVLKGKMSVFLNAANKNKEQSKNAHLPKAGLENTQVKKENKEVSESKNKKNGIASFFTQSNAKPKTIKEEGTQIQRKEKMQAEVKVEPVKEEAMEVDEVEVPKANIKSENKSRLKGLIDSDSDEDDFKPTPTPPSQVKENGKPEKASRKRSKNSNKKTGPAPKRLKKTVNQHDSDSDDIFGNDEEPEETFHNDIIENSEEESQPSQKVKILPPKNKKRTLVDKTYTDDEGFIITNKEWVEESPSEDEEKSSQATELPKDIPAKKEKENKVKSDNNKLNKIANNETNGKVTNAKGKGVKGKKVPSGNQLTLMSFFKKN